MSKPVWKDEYTSMGVTPHELYLRQQGLCKLQAEMHEDGAIVIYCTDGKDKAETDRMLNPTIECVKCMSKSLVKVIKNDIEKDTD